MRIALVAEDFYPQLGGVPEHVHHLALELQRSGHDVTVLTSHMRGDCPGNFRDQYPVRRLGTSVVVYANGGVSRITVGWRLGHRLEGILREGQFDVIHLHGGLAPTFGILTPIVARRVGVPVVATFHTWFPRSVAYQIFGRPLQSILDLHAANIAVSQPVIGAYSRYFSSRWDVIPNGVDVEYFHPDKQHPPRRGTRGPQLLYLHRLEPRNHLGTLLAAMPLILAHHPDAELIVAGDGPWRAYYQRAAKALGSAVRFLGRIDDRAEQYRTADIYLCPTMRAAFGITLLEALASGTPLIVADNPGFRSVVEDGVDAVVLPHDDPAAWAGAVTALVDDPRRRDSMSARGVEKAAGYAWPLVARRVLAVYERVLSRPHRTPSVISIA